MEELQEAMFFVSSIIFISWAAALYFLPKHLTDTGLMEYWGSRKGGIPLALDGSVRGTHGSTAAEIMPTLEKTEYSKGRGIAQCLVQGHPFILRLISGKVAGTDQRSDTRVYGSGYTSSVVGSGGYVSGGGGSTQISSVVTVQRDIYLKDESGEEHHIRIQRDVPVRMDHSVVLIYIEGNGINNGQPLPLVLYNQTLREYYEVNSLINCQNIIPLGKRRKKPPIGSLLVMILFPPLILLWIVLYFMAKSSEEQWNRADQFSREVANVAGMFIADYEASATRSGATVATEERDLPTLPSPDAST
jgi:hypothetical protein